MKYLLQYKVFESKDYEYPDWETLSPEQKFAKIILQSSPIELIPDKAIPQIDTICLSVKNYIDPESKKKINWERPVLGTDKLVKLPIRTGLLGLRDRVRWNDYLMNITAYDENVRGFYYEGFIAGLYGGKRTEKGSRPDVEINGKTVSIKTTDDAPTLGSLKQASLNVKLENGTTLFKYIDDNFPNGVLDLFSDPKNEYYQDLLWESAFRDVDYFIIIYFDNSGKKKRGEKKPTPTKIFLTTFTNEGLKNLVKKRTVPAVVPKNKGKFALRISSKFKNYAEEEFTIDIPQVTVTELDKLWNKELRKWGNYVFGEYITRRMRTDALEDIDKDRQNIASKMLEPKSTGNNQSN